MKILIACFVILVTLIAGCTSAYQVQPTKFVPIRSEANFEYFRFEAYADVQYPLDSEKGEKKRIEWLERWLVNNGYPDASYEIISRRPILKRKALLATVYDVYYEVRVKK